MFFQINVTPKAQKPPASAKETPEPQAVLILAPFQPQPHLKIESTVNVQAQTSLVIRNTSNRSLNVAVTKAPPKERRIFLSSTEISIPAASQNTIDLIWTPFEVGSWRDILQFTDSRRLKYDIPLATLCTSPKRSQKTSRAAKPQKVLAPSNSNTSSRTRTSVGRLKMASIPENKENVRKNRAIPENVYQQSGIPQSRQQCDQNIRQTHGIPKSSSKNGGTAQNLEYHHAIPENSSKTGGISQNYQANLQNVGNSQRIPENSSRFTEISQSCWQYVGIPQHDLNANSKTSDFHQQLEMSDLFNTSSYELTPLKPRSDSSNEKQIRIQKQEEPNHPDLHFSPRDLPIQSPNDQPPLRRDTYVNSEPKFCTLPLVESTEINHEEDFDDSLSPRPQASATNLPNFSQIIEDLACFQTPQKSEYLSQNGGRTVTKSSNTEGHVTNNTFEIVRSRSDLQESIALEFPRCETPSGLLTVNEEIQDEEEVDGDSKKEYLQYPSNFPENRQFLRKNSLNSDCSQFSSENQQSLMRNTIPRLERENSKTLIRNSQCYRESQQFLTEGEILRLQRRGQESFARNAQFHSENREFLARNSEFNSENQYLPSGIHESKSETGSKENYLSMNPQLSSENWTIRQTLCDNLTFPNENGQASSSKSVKGSGEQLHHSDYSFHPPPAPSSLYKSTENLNSSKFSRTFGPVSPMTPRYNSSTPISMSPVPSLRTGDRSSVKQVIEANLWLQDEPPTLKHQKSSSCESLSSTPFKRQTGAPHLNLTKTLKSPLKPMTFEISPTKKSPQLLKVVRSIQIHRISPKKPAKITKGAPKETQKILRSTKLTLKVSSAVKIDKLSLAKLQKKEHKVKETVVKFHNPNNIISHVFNPDLFAPTIIEDPFLASSLYHDENWMYHRELEFKKWLNVLLTPPENLSVDVDSVKVDVAKVWQSCRGKDSIPLAETREVVSARYHTNHRLNTLRKQALSMFNRPEVCAVMSKTIVCIEKGNLLIRQDRDLHRDIGLQKDILELFYSYNPLWLRIGLEVIYGETIPLLSNNDLVGLTKFLLARFFSEPFLVEKFSHPNSTLKTPNFMPNLNKFILKKFLLLVFFLDYAKRNRLIGHDPCLFHKRAPYKESREVLLTFARQTLSGVGDLTKLLKPYGYVVSHKQTYLDEFNYAVKDLSIDLRDGVRLCRVMDLIIGDIRLTSKCRVPAISRLQKVHNVDMALKALKEAGYVITGQINAKTIAEGHREKTLSLLWQIIYKFEAPRFEKAARVLQSWWRALLWYIRIRNFLRNRRENAALVIQCAWRCFTARRLALALKKRKDEEIRRKTHAAIVTQAWWRCTRGRKRFLRVTRSIVIIQRAWRRFSTSRPYLLELQRKKEAAIVIQNFWKSWKIMKIDRNRFLQVVQATLTLQARFSAIIRGNRERENLQKLRKATFVVQRRFRAKKSMEIVRKRYLELIQNARTIQRWWRGVILTKKVRNEFIIKKHSVRIIANWYLSAKLMGKERNEFLRMKNGALVVQRTWRRFRNTKGPMKELKTSLRATLVIQTRFRGSKARKNYRKLQKSAILIQNWYRSGKNTQKIKSDYVALRNSAILVQKTWRMKKQRRNFLKIKKSVEKIENWYSNVKIYRKIRSEFLMQKNSAICLQKWWRGVKLVQKNRQEFLQLREATINLQKFWRAKILVRKIRKDFLKLKRSVLQVQTIWRAILARKQFSDLKRRHRSAILIQQKFRARKLSKEIRKQYLMQRNSAIVIQRRFRAIVAAKSAQHSFLNLRKSAGVIQRRFRAQKAMKTARNSYLALKKSTIVIQSLWRMKMAMKTYKTMRNSAIVIQKSWRSLILTRKLRTEFLVLKKSTIFVQNKFRTKLQGRRERGNFLRLKMATILIQRTWRIKLRARQQDEAAICLQTWWRSILIGRKVRSAYENQKKSVVVIETRFRAFLLGKSVRKEFEKKKSAAKIIQRTWRCFSARKKRQALLKLRKRSVEVLEKWWMTILLLRQRAMEAEVLLEIQNRAAAVIQGFWKGYRVRQQECERIRELRLRSKRAAETAVPSTTIAYRLQEAMEGLMTYSNIGQLTMWLACIDTLTRLSIKGCVMFCEVNLVEKMYDLLEQSNRSLPWMDVCHRCANILITLAKLPDTVQYVKRLECMETIARLMSFSIKGQTELFLNLATLLWILTFDPKFCQVVVNDQRTVWLIKNSCAAALKNRSTPVKRVSKNSSIGPDRAVVLPNPKPDWGLATKKPRCFLKVEHAVYSIMERFNINNLPTF